MIKTCTNCAGDPTCDHWHNDYEMCGNWQPRIIHCGECRFGVRYVESDDAVFCMKINDEYLYDSDDFCSFGERREDKFL